MLTAAKDALAAPRPMGPSICLVKGKGHIGTAAFERYDFVNAESTCWLFYAFELRN